MKKDLYTLIINSILAVCITVGVVLGAPKASVISNSKAVDVFSPSQIFSQIKDKYNKNNIDDKTQKDNKEKTDTLWYCRLVIRYPEFFYVVSIRPTTIYSY